MIIEDIIIRLRTKLAGGIYGDPKARVGNGAQFESMLNGDTKLIVPYLYVVLGPVDSVIKGAQNTTLGQGNNVLGEIEMTETFFVCAVLDAKGDKDARQPESQLHGVRLDIFQAIFGFIGHIQRQQDIKDDPLLTKYGYCSGKVHAAGDRTFSRDRERYIRQFRFFQKSDMNALDHGIGQSFPDDAVPLSAIFADIEPTEVDISEQPAATAVRLYP